eukprot:scaffold291597_cov44-Tisochrysis_lutea.AAC.2
MNDKPVPSERRHTDSCTAWRSPALAAAYHCGGQHLRSREPHATTNGLRKNFSLSTTLALEYFTLL